MGLERVGQLRALNELMKAQFSAFPASSAMVLGVAGGNGLEHADAARYQIVYGVDVNGDYLRETAKRFAAWGQRLQLIEADLTDDALCLPRAELIIADLLVEYIGCACFQRIVRRTGPDYVSCVIQRDEADGWVSDSPYLRVFDGLETVHRSIGPETLEAALREIGFRPCFSDDYPLPNGKRLIRLDFTAKRP